MAHFDHLVASFDATIPTGARVWVLGSDNQYRLWSNQGGYTIKAKQRVYMQDPTSEAPFPQNLIPKEPAEYVEYNFPRELASGDLAVPPKYFPDEPGRNGEAAFSVTTVQPADPAAGIPQELTQTCYYFGYEPGTTQNEQVAGSIPYNQFVVDQNSLIISGPSCQGLVMELSGAAG